MFSQGTSTVREGMKFWLFQSTKMVHQTYSLKAFSFSCNQKIVTELHERCPEILTKPSARQSAYNGLLIPSPARPSLLPSFQPGYLHATLTAVECHKGYSSICWEDSRCLPTVVGPFRIKDNERERLT